MKFNNRVREIRKLRKISIQELADKLGEPYSQYLVHNSFYYGNYRPVMP